MYHLIDAYPETDEEVQQTNSNVNLVASWATNILKDAEECQKCILSSQFCMSDRPRLSAKLGEIIGQCEAIIQATGGRLT